jgi:transposase
MSSCEKQRSSAYSDDLRWRMIWQKEALGLDDREVAKNLGVDASTVRRTVTLFKTTGDVQKKSYPTASAFRSISEPVQFYLISLLHDKPGIYLREMTATIEAQLGVEVTESAICKFLKKAGFTRQRLTTYALQRDEELRMKYALELSLYPVQTLMFVDEMGTDRRDTIRKIGYCMRGHPAKAQKLLVRGTHISVIAALSIHGIQAIEIVRGGVDADVYYDFTCKHLLPKLMPFNGINDHSVIVQDNCSIHHVTEIEKLVEDTGVILLYLPPYSPDYNPIEEAFAKVKSTLKALETEMQHTDDIEMIVCAAFSTITTQDCIGWIRHAGIYNGPN